MKVKIEGKKAVMFARTVLSLTQFNTVNVEMKQDFLSLTASNSVNGRSVQHIFGSYFFSVLDKCDITSNLSVNISELVDSFENFPTMAAESVPNHTDCVLEIADEKLVIKFVCLGDFVRITLDQDIELITNPTGKVKSLKSELSNDTPDIEDLIAEAIANDMPEYILKTMKAVKKKNCEVIVID